MKVVGVKYCGGCNPEVRRKEPVETPGRLLPKGVVSETGEPSQPWEAAILVCGCSVACADEPR